MSMKPKVCVLRAPGTNCDVETAFAFESCGAVAERVHLFRVLEQPALLKDYQVLCVPGGFSYGDDIGSGVIFSRHLRNRLADALGEFVSRDTLALGICNGFQVLLKAGILPGPWLPPPVLESPATLTWNLNGKYTALWVKLAVEPGKCAFLQGMSEIELPIAHGEGRIVVRNEAVLDEWEQNGQAVLRYAARNAPALVGAGAGGTVEAGSSRELLPYPENPNGSTANIAGLCDPSGRVFGLMPHPERFLFATQHPRWTRLKLTGEGAGMQIFRNAVKYFE
jgi:phosphoribosylformylglycinamidine synthase